MLKVVESWEGARWKDILKNAKIHHFNQDKYQDILIDQKLVLTKDILPDNLVLLTAKGAQYIIEYSQILELMGERP